MTCKRAEWQIADWVAGRLDQRDAQFVEDHCRVCTRCASLADDERALRSRFAVAQAPERKLDLWPAVAVRSSGWLPRKPVLWPRRLALGSALACACLVVALAVRSPIPPVGVGAGVGTAQVDEARAVRLVADTREFPNVDTDSMMIEARYTAVPAASRSTGE